MFDAICVFDKDKPKTYSIFAFKQLPAAQIDKLRYSLLCPVCKQQAYFRKASKDGKQACFGSRYHEHDCAEFHPGAHKTEEQKQSAEIDKILLEEDALAIDFGKQEILNKPLAAEEKMALPAGKLLSQQTATKESVSKTGEAKVGRQGLAKLLSSLLRGSSLATSDLWIYTSDTHKWRAKNLFVNIKDAQQTENGAPRIYWGTISHADHTLHWLNPAEDRHVGIPIAKYREQLLSRFAIDKPRDVEGAGFIMFGKCLLSKDKKRRYIQLWGNDPHYLYLSKVLDE